MYAAGGGEEPGATQVAAAVSLPQRGRTVSRRISCHIAIGLRDAN